MDWTGLLTRQNETRHLTGWTVDQRVSAGKWPCPEDNRKERLNPLPALTQASRKYCPQWGFWEGSECGSSMEYRGDLCLEDITEPSVRVTPPTVFSLLSSAQKQQSHTVTKATRQMWPNFQPLSFCACCFSWPPVLLYCTAELPPLLPLPDKSSPSL